VYKLFAQGLFFQNPSYICASKKAHNMKNNEEYVNNPGRDWLIFLVSTVGMIALLIWLPEWVWVAWPFQFTALAGALGRL
jgi:hypothetical protein